MDPNILGSATLHPMAQSINKWMFYALDQTETHKSTVVCIHQRYFITLRQGPHLELKVGDSFRIFPANEESAQDRGRHVTVVNINEDLNFILLRSEEYIGEEPPGFVQAEESESFLLAGFGVVNTGRQELVYSTGIVHTLGYCWMPHSERPDAGMQGPFFLGTVSSSFLDSGGGCWSARGLIGIDCGVTAMPASDYLERLPISRAAIYSPRNYMIAATSIKLSLEAELKTRRMNAEKRKKKDRDDDEDEPPKKHKHLL